MYIFIKDYKDVKQGTVIDEGSALFDFKEMLVEMGVLVEAERVQIDYNIELADENPIDITTKIDFSEADNTLPKVEPKSYSGKWYVNADFDLSVNGLTIPIRKRVANTIYFDNTEIDNSEVRIGLDISEQQKESICESLKIMGLISREPKKYIRHIEYLCVDEGTPYEYEIQFIKPKEYVARCTFQCRNVLYKIGEEVVIDSKYKEECLIDGLVVEKSDDLREFISLDFYSHSNELLLSKGDRFLESKDYKNENAILVSELENKRNSLIEQIKEIDVLL